MDRGRVTIDDRFQTNVPGIYAIGDVVRGPMLAHKAEDEGVALAEILAGQHGHVNYEVIPGVVYTMPEVAAVGRHRGGAEGRGRCLQGRQVFRSPRTGVPVPWRHTEGFVKVLADAETDRVLGVHIIGAGRRGSRRRGRRADGVRRLVRGHGPHLPCASDDVGGDEGGRDGGSRSARSTYKPVGAWRLDGEVDSAASRMAVDVASRGRSFRCTARVHRTQLASIPIKGCHQGEGPRTKTEG